MPSQSSLWSSQGAGLPVQFSKFLWIHSDLVSEDLDHARTQFFTKFQRNCEQKVAVFYLIPFTNLHFAWKDPREGSLGSIARCQSMRVLKSYSLRQVIVTQRKTTNKRSVLINFSAEQQLSSRGIQATRGRNTQGIQINGTGCRMDKV